eukprot:3941799-Rhodomonas_salina.3
MLVGGTLSPRRDPDPCPAQRVLGDLQALTQPMLYAGDGVRPKDHRGTSRCLRALCGARN